MILVGDFGQLEPIDDRSNCDNESRYLDTPTRLLHLWRHAEYGKELLKHIHRTKEDMWWT